MAVATTAFSHLCRADDHTANLVNAARELRAKYLNDPHRPTWHFMASEGVCFPFDPQGCVFWKGKYHLFYAIQVNGKGSWGHASSIDLVHWVHHPVPLTIDPGDPEEHVFAGGSLINMDGVPTMIYHGVNSSTCIATSNDDDLIRWTKSSRNPVIQQPKEGDPNHGRYHVWDTCGWVKDGMYYSISGDHPGRRRRPLETSAIFFARETWSTGNICIRSISRSVAGRPQT